MRVFLASLLLVAAPLNAQATRSASPGAAPPPAKLADLAWLAGEWSGDGFAGPAREVYSPPMGGVIAGHFIQQKGAGILFFEIVTIAQKGDSLTYRLKHFNADLTGWEEKGVVQEFPLVAVENDSWYFDGLTIRRVGPDEMHGSVRIKPKDGPPSELTVKYRRAR